MHVTVVAVNGGTHSEISAFNAGGRRAAICNPLKPPHEIPIIPTEPDDHACVASHSMTSMPSSCSRCAYSSLHQPIGVAHPGNVHAGAGVAVGGEPTMHGLIALSSTVPAAIRDVLQYRRHSLLAGRSGQEQAHPQSSTVAQDDPLGFDLVDEVLNVSVHSDPPTSLPTSRDGYQSVPLLLNQA